MKLLALLLLPLAACAGLAGAPGASSTVDPTFDTSSSATVDPVVTPDPTPPDPTPPDPPSASAPIYEQTMPSIAAPHS
ncbi:MAG TPA: hypothetical protein VGM88_27185 [Kofleriaceae bacterium]|jgi:hypothetical protein